jgi:hypothetical protein
MEFQSEVTGDRLLVFEGIFPVPAQMINHLPPALEDGKTIER